ncbi:V-set and immunoglobulin domain-containing protein 4 isoform X1 [Eublepharis macularius]|uniref:V-set and immunoglobulin domain-containing protein 4 isoform X1 n=1 Tax=Eublepharis macularius TaxID=481883 RepID=UPI00240F759A|nr:V-set and immunoglobulin domain-containing protein 4 isoform X1 [Eublepharis macularius]
MERSVWLRALVLASMVCGGKTLLDLTGMQETEGTWKASVNLPCVYEPSADFRQEVVSWKISLPDHSIRTIFRRDPNSGDQTLLTRFKNRIYVPKDRPGDVSLLIEDLEIADRGQYTCEVVWVARNKSRRTKERIITLSVVKVAVTKPVITARGVAPILPRGKNISLTCQANGSPPITYRWFKAGQQGDAERVGETAVLHFDGLQVSDTGTYYCEVRNQVSPAAQQSSAFQLTVKDPSEVPTLRPSFGTVGTTIAETDLVATSLAPWEDGRISEHQAGNSAPRRTALPLYVIVLIAVLCAMVLLAVFTVIFCRKKHKADHTYEVTYNNRVTVAREDTSPAAAGACGGESGQGLLRANNDYTMEPTKIADYVPMNTKMDNEYETLVHKMESEYEVTDGVVTWRPSQ